MADTDNLYRDAIRRQLAKLDNARTDLLCALDADNDRALSYAMRDLTILVYEISVAHAIWKGRELPRP